MKYAATRYKSVLWILYDNYSPNRLAYIRYKSSIFRFMMWIKVRLNKTQIWSMDNNVISRSASQLKSEFKLKFDGCKDVISAYQIHWVYGIE